MEGGGQERKHQEGTSQSKTFLGGAKVGSVVVSMVFSTGSPNCSALESSRKLVKNKAPGHPLPRPVELGSLEEGGPGLCI